MISSPSVPASTNSQRYSCRYHASPNDSRSWSIQLRGCEKIGRPPSRPCTQFRTQTQSPERKLRAKAGNRHALRRLVSPNRCAFRHSLPSTRNRCALGPSLALGALYLYVVNCVCPQNGRGSRAHGFFTAPYARGFRQVPVVRPWEMRVGWGCPALADRAGINSGVGRLVPGFTDGSGAVKKSGTVHFAPNAATDSMELIRSALGTVPIFLQSLGGRFWPRPGRPNDQQADRSPGDIDAAVGNRP